MTNSGTDDEVIPDAAEATDGSVLGEDGGDDTLPGTVGFPPADPIGVGPADSTTDAEHHDSVAERSDREQIDGSEPLSDPIRLVDPDGGGSVDTEDESIGEAVDAIEMVSPEEAAMHTEGPD